MHRVSLSFAVESDGNDILEKDEITPFLYKHELYTSGRSHCYSYGDCPNHPKYQAYLTNVKS